ncbi:stonustoxin subunit alpha-like [Tachyglossus aculeatus]|uniref:stonustoxin subunit alpha-like n=1 Tax=Tachyglossus aculeatus TaxID=9261 RepID=UPI0018F5B786|nr:stonustoxin subunit alpha-like [Tachyglossus aculeatus]
MDLKPIEMPTLGRPLQLGMLYDCRDDRFIPGVTLWDINDTEKDMRSQVQHRTEFRIIASDSLEEKSNALSISASLKASFLGGLVSVEGSAKYVNDTKKSKQQARVTLHYSTTTEFKQLTMKHLGRQNITYPDVFDNGTATHVVTGVLFGAQAFFVFDREVSSSETIQDVQGSLKVTVTGIPFMTIEGEGSASVKDKEKKNQENFHCTFYGDFALKNTPKTYMEAIEVYSSLPKLLGEHGEKAVPVMVWLYPLEKLDSRAAKLVREISIALVNETQAVLEGLTDCLTRCNDMLASKAAAFPEIKSRAERFRQLVQLYKLTFQKQLSSILPHIRGGGKQEESLAELLASKEQSPLCAQRINEFLNRSEGEINFVNAYLVLLEEVAIALSENERDKVLFEPNVNFVFAFTFTSLPEEVPYLSELNLWFQKNSAQETQDPPPSIAAPQKSKSSLWFRQKGIQKKLRQTVISFLEFAKANGCNKKIRFIVASEPNQDIPAASIYLYEQGEPIDTSFEPPSIPTPPQIDRVRHDHVQFVLTPTTGEREEIKCYQVEYRAIGEVEWVVKMVDRKQEKILITGLVPNTHYQFRIADVYVSWRSQSSDVSDPVKTLPTGPPGKLSAVLKSRQVVTLCWQRPKVIPKEIVVSEYRVEFREEAGGAGEQGGSEWRQQTTGEDTETCDINELKTQTLYRFRVSAVCVDGCVGDPSEEILVSTIREKEKLSLDPETANEYLCLSKGNKSMEWIVPPQRVSQNHKRFVGEAYVLGSRGFQSGQHYWEVEVEGKGLCKIGVAAESVERKSSQAHEKTIWSLTICTPYHVFINNEPNPNIEVPRIVGVLLDFDGGQVIFYNAETQEEIHTYHVIFQEKIFPLLGFQGQGARLTLRS